MFVVFMMFTALEIEVFTLHRTSAFTGNKTTNAACFPANKTLCFPGGQERSFLLSSSGHWPFALPISITRMIAGIWSLFHTDNHMAAA